MQSQAVLLGCCLRYLNFPGAHSLRLFGSWPLIARLLVLPFLSFSTSADPVTPSNIFHPIFHPHLSSFYSPTFEICHTFPLATFEHTFPAMNTTLSGPIPVARATTLNSTKSFPFTIPAASPTTDYTNPLDPPQQANSSQQTVFSVIIIVSCIGLLGFGIGYLRLRQMRRVNCSSSSTSTPSSQPPARSPDLEEAVGMDTVSPPIYAGPSSITILESSNPVHSPHCHFKEAPPPYEARP